MRKYQDSRNRAIMIKIESEQALELQERCPQIAEDFRRGMFYGQIVEKYRIVDFFGITGKNSAKNAARVVALAISGVQDSPNDCDFSGLMDRAEWRAIYQQHQLGNRYAQCIENNSNGKGLANRTREELHAASLEAIAARGQVAWSKPVEINLALRLSENQSYQTTRGVDWKKVAEELAKNGYPLRTPKAVKVEVYKQMKRN